MKKQILRFIISGITLPIMLMATAGDNVFDLSGNSELVGSTKGNFSVEQGSANYTLKLSVPNGVAGMKPKLALNYNSADERSYMGVGWSIGGVNTITRCEQTQVVDGDNHAFGVNYTQTDRFCLDGQRLIVINGLPYGSDGAEYRTEIDTYAKVISHGTQGTGPQWFEVKTKSGLTYEYGKENSSALEITSGGTVRFWKIGKIKDTFENAIDFNYIKNEALGYHYIDKVTYSNNTVQYNYETRPDISKGYVAGYVAEINKRLESVTVSTGSTEISSYAITYKNETIGIKGSIVESIVEQVAGVDLKPLFFTYDETGVNTADTATSWYVDSDSTYNDWEISAQDMNGDGLADLVQTYKGTEGHKFQVSFNNDNGFEASQMWYTDTSSNYKDWEIFAQDINNDGLADLVQTYKGTEGHKFQVSLNNGSGFDAETMWYEDTTSSYENWEISAQDMNGDGLPDLIQVDKAVRSHIFRVSINTGTGFDTSSNWFSSSAGWRHWGIYAQDMNGDGLPDLVQPYSGTYGQNFRINLNTGNGFGSAETWFASSSLGGWGIYAQDMNGDGLPDMIQTYIGSSGHWFRVAMNKGNGFESSITWISDSSLPSWELYAQDMNGDGLPDIIQKYKGASGHRFKVGLNTGKGNGVDYIQHWLSDSSSSVSSGEIFAQDMNGDGLVDIVQTYKGTLGHKLSVSLNKNKPLVLTQITNHTDQDIKINYKSMHDSEVYHNYTQNGERNAYPWNNIANDNIEITSSMDLVSSVERMDGVGGYRQLRYKYYGYIVNKKRGAQGFHSIDILDDTTQMTDSTYFKQIEVPDGVGFQYTGMPYASYEGKEFGGATGEQLNATAIVYKDSSTRAKTYEPYTYANIQTLYDPDSKQALKKVYHYNHLSEDGLGNVEKVVDRIQDMVNNQDFYKTIINEYTLENEEKWHIGRLSKATVTHTQSAGGTVIRASSFTYNDKGVLSQEVANVGTSVALSKDYSYDSFGNKISESISGAGVQTVTTTYGYSADGKYKTNITNAEGLSESYTYDARFGTPLTHTGPNGLTTTWQYDDLGRKTEELRADGTWRRWSHVWRTDMQMNSRSVYGVIQSVSGKASLYTTYDSLGRPTEAFTATLGGKKLNTLNKEYDQKGQVVKEIMPYIAGEGSAGIIRTTYDRYGRTTSASKPGPNNQNQTFSTNISNFTTMITDPSGSQKQTIQNAIGQTLSITDALGSSESSSIVYSYDAIGNLLSTTDSSANVISMAYNAAGKKTYMSDPDLGVWNYSYNAVGKMTSQSNQQGQQTNINYDILGRMTYKSVQENTSYNETSYVYAGVGATAGSRGKLLSSTSTSVLHGTDAHSQTKSISYDSLGRPTQSTTNISGRGEYTSNVSYDSYSRPVTQTYPNGYETTNTYDPTTGIATSVTGSDNKVHYKIDKLNAFGQIKNATYANGVKTLTAHDNAGYIGSIISYTASAFLGDVQRLDYSYDAMGNVVERVDNSIDGKQILDTFSYDAMNRLSSQTTTSDVIGNYEKSKAYRYDKLGNITFQTGLGAYTYYPDKPHAVKQAGNRNYTYDSLGNMTNRNGDAIVYNPLNKPAILTNHLNGSEVRFYYGVGGQRYMKTTQETDTYYLGKSYEEQVKGSEETQICYISLGGKTIGSHTQVLNTNYVETNENYKETPFNRYFHSDALGSITAITDDSGTVVERRSYEAFGKIRAMDYGTNDNSITSNLTIETTRAFTGHEQIAELSGLIHMNARVYDSDIGRFLSADTIVQDPRDSQAYNRYAYVRNNPMMFIDPSGHSWFSKKWKKFKKWAKRKWRKIVGGILVVVGVVAGFTPFAWASKPLIGTGASLIAYDPSRPESRSNQVTVSVGTTVPINFGGGSGKNPAEQEEQIDDLRAEEAARAKTYTGTQNNLSASSDNNKYANGAGSGSYEHTGGDMVTDANGNRVYQNESIGVRNSRQKLLDSRVNYLRNNSSALDVDVQNSLNGEHRYVGTPYIFGGTGTYNAGKRSSGRVDYSFMPFTQSTDIDGFGTLTREHRIDYLILHEVNHYGSRVLMNKNNYRTHTSTLGPRGLGIKHEEYYEHKVNQDFIKVHPIYAF